MDFLLAASLLIVGILGIIVGTLSLEAEGRAFFVFGDSLVDSGNNNYVATSARADSPPYGIDYPTHRPTGRFSNGLNIPDIISESIGEESVLPYLSPELRGNKLLNGANFASAGVGILNDTGIQFVNVITMPQQLQYFQKYQQRVTTRIGDAQTKRLVNQALVLICVGGNDFVNNYYLIRNSARSRQYPLEDYVPYLISEYKKILIRLYDMGARNVLVTGTGPLGCVPAEIARHSPNASCATDLQRAASLYNPQLFQMITQLNSEIGAGRTNAFYAVNSYQMNIDFIINPQAYGFVTSKIACCGQGPYNGIGPCTALSNLCPNRDIYAFWDPFHPCERANRYIVRQILSGTTEYMQHGNLSTILANTDSRT
ncbi:GDSL esterase/lipase At5g33370-like [Telopea speciosissima]|uniref:GDSL esterase/lipase At5g33370-like n=1 Tax=Telopea speciosissima TaxID=54955 RepID=UPI001CC79C38|nr:GDSL esterase/lipase At5g33370-like [Telopea speciosissima]